ncbi:MAG: protein-glutamate O-methyltransferase CheR [Leptospira sp.]|nr:protein-glutamate O-methyltransferase CheR [Leptospira sp.]
MAGDHKRLVESIARLTGFKLEDDKLYLLESRLSDIMKNYKLESYDEVCNKLDQGLDTEFIGKVIDQITTHETRFFRDESLYDALVMQIIPEWLERNMLTPFQLKGHRLKIWSSACSTGQEAYSIAMMISEKFPSIFESLEILATDISPATIAKAQNGRYTQFETDRGLPARFREKFFQKLDSGEWQLSDVIRSKVRFQKHNLITDPYPNGFDIILCRNVVIYFPEQIRPAIFDKLKKSLSPDSVLILGSSETLIGYSKNYVIREFGLARYYEFPEKVTFF